MPGGRGLLAALLLALVAFAAGAAEAAARSPFRLRGVIEGAYGRPWDAGQRARMLAFMARAGFNAYVHAPKEDLYQRARWRDPYPAAEQEVFDREIAGARRRGVKWIPNLSPGAPAIPPQGQASGPLSAPLCYSCPRDLAAVLGKLEPFRRAGARTFMVSFDDVRKVFAHDEDRTAYGTGDEAYGRANGDFLTRLAAALRARDARARLLTVAADYLGTTDTPYLRGLRATLDSSVEVMWTGPALFSADFTAAEAGDYGRAIGRTPLVWDNWTVNDYEGNFSGPDRTRRIHLGPYRRSPLPAGAVGGFFLNPMNEASLNALPFLTAADYLADPSSYRARLSFRRAARRLGGPARANLRAFAEVNYSDPFDRANGAPTFATRSRALLRAYERGGRWPGRAQALRRELALVAGAVPALRAWPALRRFVHEGRRFLRAAARSARAGEAALALLEAERPALTIRATAAGSAGRALPPSAAAVTSRRAALAARGSALRADFRNTYGDRAVQGRPAPTTNLMDTFLAAVESLDAAWRPRAETAGAKLTLTVGGRPVALSATGRFVLPSRDAGELLEAVDGAGGRVVVRVPRPTI
jgi:hypothetical protein